MLDAASLLVAIRSDAPRRSLYRLLQSELTQRQRSDVGRELVEITKMLHVSEPSEEEMELLRRAADWLLPSIFVE